MTKEELVDKLYDILLFEVYAEHDYVEGRREAAQEIVRFLEEKQLVTFFT